jgi:tetratricopeptide (TPR) repeat protein
MDRPALNSIVPVSKKALDNSRAKVFEECLQSIHTKQKLNHVNSFTKGVEYIDGVLTVDECNLLRKTCDNCDELKFWSSAGRNDDAARSFRDADTIEVNSKVLSGMIWERMKHILHTKHIVILDNEDDENWERELIGEWEATSLNHDLLFAKYPSEGSFAPHTDGRAIHDFNTRSFSSVIIFLNDILATGGTRFYKTEATQNLQLLSSGDAANANRWTADESLVVDTVSAVAGRMLIFNQSLVHEGLPPATPNSKYIIRSDIMYTRTPAICAQPKDLEAYSIFREAEDLAERGLADEAIPFFRRAFKLSPDLARVMGQG